MPEENFEQQARRKAEEFGMEPKPEVWLRVEAAIAPQKRRRRLLVWWWLLPLCMAGILAFWFAQNDNAKLPADRTAAVVHNNETESKKKPALDSILTGKEKSRSLIKERKKKTNVQVTEHRVKTVVHYEPKKSFVTSHLPLAVGDKNNIEIKKEKKDVPEKAMPENELKTDRIAMLKTEQETSHGFAVNSLPRTSDSTGNVDTLFSGMNVPAANDSVSGIIEINKAASAKKDDRKKWRLGVITELGLTSWGKDFFTKELEADTASKFYSAVNSITLDSFIANTSEIRQTKNGVDVGVGFVMRKELGKQFYINGQMGYRYQQYTLYNLRKSAPAPNSSSSRSSIYLFNKDNYHHHFLNLAVSVGRTVFSGRRTGLSAEAGFDNALLLVMKQKENKNTAADFNMNNRLGTMDFFRWQPSLLASLPLNWYSQKQIRFSVSPFVRFGVKSFEKNGGSYGNNHLISGGVQAIYFFK